VHPAWRGGLGREAEPGQPVVDGRLDVILVEAAGDGGSNVGAQAREPVVSGGVALPHVAALHTRLTGRADGRAVEERPDRSGHAGRPDHGDLSLCRLPVAVHPEHARIEDLVIVLVQRGQKVSVDDAASTRRRGVVQLGPERHASVEELQGAVGAARPAPQVPTVLDDAVLDQAEQTIGVGHAATSAPPESRGIVPRPAPAGHAGRRPTARCRRLHP
jgi:hypothetical protein